jgi:uncharacterized protein YdeI (YjbR/CyaY-like superfamily)
MDNAVELYIQKAKKWQAEMTLLRSLLLGCGLEEAIKWGKPCYAKDEKNIIIIQAFKEHCALGFFNGALLKDTKGLLVKAGENSQAGRQMRFTSIQEIEKQTSQIRAYIKEAIQVQKAGTKLELPAKDETMQLDELTQAFKKKPALQKAFEALTPGRQRAYLIYFSGAKQAETRKTRIENYTAKILCGKGFNDCTCGLSKRMPNCDGSHKSLKA